jgi:hypothetical protein
MWSMRHLVEREVAHAGAGVDEHVVVEQEGGGSAAGGNRARATEDADLHGRGGTRVPGSGRADPQKADAAAGAGRPAQGNGAAQPPIRMTSPPAGTNQVTLGRDDSRGGWPSAVDELHLRAGEFDHVAVAQRHRVADQGTPLTLGGVRLRRARRHSRWAAW